MKAAVYGLQYVLRSHFTYAPPPLIRGLVLTNRCNLHCQHCRLALRGGNDLSINEAKAAVNNFYEEGGRCLYLEGGEPFLWRDEGFGIEDIVDYAHRRGYLTVVVYTNGTYPLETSADTLFVSIDGLQATHDALRGESFNRIMENVRNSRHRSLFVNFTINRKNKDEIRPFCEFIRPIAQVRGVFFYFHTPYYGRDNLYLDKEERRRVTRELLMLRKQFPILNSRAGLNSALRNDWKRPMPICSVFEKGVVHQCCRVSDNSRLCEDCGYLSYAEIDQTLKLKPSAIWNALKYFRFRPRH